MTTRPLVTFGRKTTSQLQGTEEEKEEYPVGVEFEEPKSSEETGELKRPEEPKRLEEPKGRIRGDKHPVIEEESSESESENL